MSANLQTSVIGFKGMVYNKLTAPTSSFAWRITFPDETPLSIIPEENFYITDKNNYIFDFLIKIEKATNSVIVTPKDTYDTNVYYFLHIKKFTHGSGKFEKVLPSIHVGFKVLNDDKLDLVWLKGGFNPETAMERASKVTERRINSIKQEYLGRVKYIYNIFPLRIVTILNCIEILALGIILSFLNIPIQNIDSIHLIVIAVLALGYILQLILTSMEYKSGKRSAVEQYNNGVSNFNVGNYQIAENFLSDAIVLDPNNEMIDKAIEINRKYLTIDKGTLLKNETYLERMKFNYNNTLLICSGIMGLLYCVMSALELFNLLSDRNVAVVMYFKILFITVVVLHFIFSFIQSKSLEFNSVTAYNKGVDIFEEGDLDGAIIQFRLALKHNSKNSRAYAAKDLLSFVLVKEKQRLEREAQEAAEKARKDEREKAMQEKIAQKRAKEES